MVCACPSSVRLNEWSESSRAAPGQSPAACVCRIASTTWPCRANHCAARKCSTGTCSGSVQPKQIPEQVVVPEPGPLGVQRQDKRVRVLQVQQDPFRARVAGQHCSKVTDDP